jgi:hypothetical protein
VTWIDIDAKHEILKDHNTSACTFFVELIRFILTTAPDSNHVIVGLFNCIHILSEIVGSFKLLICEAWMKHVRWYIVSTFGIHRMAIYDELKI